MSRANNRYISVIGSGECSNETYSLAEKVGALLAQAGCTVVCGGLAGVMEAVSKGAAEKGGDVIAVIPGADSATANQYATHVVATGVGYARNVAVVASGDVVIAVAGKWGTLSEIGHARTLGKTVVALDSWKLEQTGFEVEGVLQVSTPEAAVETALKLLKVQ